LKRNNLILVTMDAVRPDHLSCYGYKRMKTAYIDSIAEGGVLFENCICSSCLTPVSHASILTGNNPHRHKVRDPFCKINSRTLAEILKENEYKTAGFVGVNFLSSQVGFNKGFDYFDEPTKESSWNKKEYKGEKNGLESLWGNWWVDRMLKWLREHASSNFFIWGHYFECHFLAEKPLLYSGKMERDKLSDYAYYDAKIKYMNEQLFGPLVGTLKELGLYENTTIVITSDHGEQLGPKQPNWEDYYFNYPQHKTMYDYDLKVPLIINSKDLACNKRIKHTVRAIDLVPTLINLLGISTSDSFDGLSLLPLINGEEFEELTAYSEELYEKRGEGSLQAVRTDAHKLIRNITKQKEEFYDICKDAEEGNNIINTTNSKEQRIITEFRGIMQQFLGDYFPDIVIEGDERDKIEASLRSLGYIN